MRVRVGDASSLRRAAPPAARPLPPEGRVFFYYIFYSNLNIFFVHFEKKKKRLKNMN